MKDAGSGYLGLLYPGTSHSVPAHRAVGTGTQACGAEGGSASRLWSTSSQSLVMDKAGNQGPVLEYVESGALLECIGLKIRNQAQKVLKSSSMHQTIK